MVKLTEKQRAVLTAWIDPELQRPPSFDEVSKATGVPRGSVGQTLSALRKKGYLDERNQPVLN